MVTTRSKKDPSQTSNSITSPSGKPPRTPTTGRKTPVASTTERKTPLASTSRSVGSASAGSRRRRKPVDNSSGGQSSDDQSESEEETSVASGTSGTSTGSNKREKLSLVVEKQLLQDIEERGGLALFDAGKTQGLAELLDNQERENIYGPKGGPLREKIRKRVFLFKKWDTDRYRTHLRRLGVKRRKSVAATLPSAIDEEGDQDVSDLEDDPATPAVQQKKKESRPRPVAVEPAKEPTRRDTEEEEQVFHLPARSARPVSGRSVISTSEGSSSNMKTQEIEVDGSTISVKVLDVDTDKWNQGEGIKICRFTAHKYGGKQYSGFEFAIVADARDLELYSLEARPPPVDPNNPSKRQGNAKPNYEFIFTKPEIEAPHWLSKKNYEKIQKHKAIKTGHGIAATAYAKLSPERRLEKYLIRFPTSMKLTDLQFLGAGDPTDDPVIRQSLIMGKVSTGVQRKGEDLKTYTFTLQWYLCDMNSEDDIDGVDNTKRRKAQDLINEVGENDSDDDEAGALRKDDGDY